MIGLRFYRIYDIGREIDLGNLELALAQSYFTARASFTRVKTKSIMIEEPPLLLRMHPVQIEREGRFFDLSVVVRLYDIGGISLCFIYEEPDAPAASIEEKALLFAGQDGLSDLFGDYLRTLGEILKPHLKAFSLDPDFYEDYTIYTTDRIDESIDLAVLLSGERTRFSPQMRDEIVKNTLSYSVDDRVYLSWDSALVCDPESPTDLIDIIEYANVQVLELRYYDRELTRQMAKMYDDIEVADRLTGYRRKRLYHSIMTQIMETYAEISEITEKIDNLIKVTEDVYYARVYATVLRVMRSGQWNDSVNRKITVIHENYTMLSDEVHIQHSNFLEWIVIILIAFEVVLGILKTIGFGF